MKVRQPEPFTFKAGERAVLLLHGFTGHSADVRMLGRYLEKKGYTSYAPIYRGHGLTPEALLNTEPEDWWEDVQAAYQHLLDLGYEEIAVAGLSLGGILSLKLANCHKVKAVIPMCTPMIFDNKNNLQAAFRTYVKQYKKQEWTDETIIEKETNQIMEKSEKIFKDIAQFNNEVKEEVDMIYAPTFIVQARKDQIINPESANYIYKNVESTIKELKWYEASSHFITFGPERDQLHEDIYQFLESLDWIARA